MQLTKQLPTDPKELAWYRWVDVIYAHDGDSITHYVMDKGFGDSQTVKRGEKPSIRLYGINTPELNQEAGRAAREVLKRLEGYRVLVRSRKGVFGKYGRYLFEVFASERLFDESATDRFINVNQLLVDRGLAELVDY